MEGNSNDIGDTPAAWPESSDHNKNASVEMWPVRHPEAPDHWPCIPDETAGHNDNDESMTMTVKIFDTPEVQDFLNTVAGFDQEGGSERAKQIMHRLLSDLFRLMDDYDVSAEEFWSAVSVLNALGNGTQFGLLAPGLGFDHYLDMRMDAADRER
ncbi:catechol dioxygenase-like protein, partial [Halomonas ventosae]